MPTPTGLLKVGDVIKHIATGTVCVVTERLGNDINYAVRIRNEKGERFKGNKKGTPKLVVFFQDVETGLARGNSRLLYK